MKITDHDQAAALLAVERPLAWCVGMLPDAPATAVTHIYPITIGEAEALHANEILMKGQRYTPADGHRATIAKTFLVNPAEILLDGLEPADVPTEDLVPIFEPTLDSIGDIGDALDTLGAALLGVMLDATGWRNPPEADPFQGIETYRAAAKYRGRWVDNVLPWKPEAAFYVRPVDEAVRAAAAAASDLFGVSNPVSAPIRVLTDCVRTGPGGDELLTFELAKSLPYGAAMAMFRTAEALTIPQGVAAAVRFRSVAKPAERKSRKRGGQGLVGDRKAAPPAK